MNMTVNEALQISIDKTNKDIGMASVKKQVCDNPEERLRLTEDIKKSMEAVKIIKELINNKKGGNHGKTI